MIFIQFWYEGGTIHCQFLMWDIIWWSKINYVTHDIINLLPIKIWWANLLPHDTISVLIMMMKGMIIWCFKWNYEHETSLQGLSPSEWLLARTSQLHSIIELLLSYMVTLSKLTNGKFLHTPLNWFDGAWFAFTYNCLHSKCHICYCTLPKRPSFFF